MQTEPQPQILGSSPRLEIGRRIFVGICLALVFVPIGLPRWGSIERGKVELSFGLFQSQKTFPAPNGAHAHASCVLGFENFDDSKLQQLQAGYNFGRFLAMLSFIPILMILGRTKSSKQLMIRSIVAVGYFCVVTVLMGTTIRDKNTLELVRGISRKCDPELRRESLEVGDDDGETNDDIGDGPMKYLMGVSFGLYVVILVALVCMSGVAIYCQLSGNHMFVGKDVDDQTYQLMSQPTAEGQSVNMGHPAIEDVPQQYAYQNTGGSVSGMQATIRDA